MKTTTCNDNNMLSPLMAFFIASVSLLGLATAAELVVLQNNDITLGEDPGSQRMGKDVPEYTARTFWTYQNGQGIALTEGNFDDDPDEELKYSNESGVSTFMIGLRHEFARDGDLFLENIGSHPTFAFECTVLPDETDAEVTSVELILSLRGQIPEKVHYSLPAYVISADFFGLPQSVKFDLGNDEQVKSLLQKFMENSDANYLNITLTKISRPAAIGGEGVRNASTVLLDDFRLE
jgi:hypothetical protein